MESSSSAPAGNIYLLESLPSRLEHCDESIDVCIYHSLHPKSADDVQRLHLSLLQTERSAFGTCSCRRAAGLVVSDRKSTFTEDVIGSLHATR
jgi:hypothetical protein